MTEVQPVHLELFVGRRCNLRCPSCLWVLEDGDFFNDNELSLDEAKRIAAHFRQKGTRSIYLQSEGEVLLYDHFEELYRFCTRDLGYRVETIVTNGILLDTFEKFILEEMDSQTILISLDGYDAATYEARRGVGAKVYGRIIDNVVRLGEKVREHGVNVRINVNCIVGKWNYRYIGPMIALAQRLGNIGTISFGNFHPVGDAGTLRPLYKGDQEVVEYLGSMIARTDYELNIVLPSLCGRRTRFVCEMLFDTVLVGCTGDFSPCCHISTSPEWGNLYTDIEGYRHGALKSFRDRFSAARTYEDLPQPCRECPRLTRHQCRFDASRRTWVGTEFIE